MAAALKQLASDIELRVRMAQSARQRVEEHFDWQERGEWMNAVYHKAAGCRMNVATHAPVTIGATGTVER
jgi:glycosyltransferase involved in cell wall biosynthesis